MLKKINYKLIILFTILFVAIIPNFSNAAVSVGQVKNLKVSTTSTTQIKVTWSKVSGATAYRLYKYNSKTKKYEYYGQTKSTSMTVKKLTSATTYKFKVRALKTVKGKNYYGKYSSILTATTYPDQTKNLKMKSQTDTTVTISWDKVSRVTGYRVYIYNESKKAYEYYGYTTTNSMTIKKLTSAKTYKVRVRAYKKVSGKYYLGAYATAIQVVTKPVKQTGVKVKDTTTGTITLSWNKVARASGYRVYMYKANSNSYEYCAQTTTDTCTTISNLSSGTAYQFKVRAYINFNGTWYWGTFSDVLKTSTLSNRVNNLKTTAQTATSINIKWDKVEKTTGYEVFVWSGVINVSDNTKAFKSYKTTTNTSMSISNLTSTKLYEIYVMAYSEVDGKKYYGEKSNIITVRTANAEGQRVEIDVSSHQEEINWKSVKNAGVEFVMIRAGYRGYGSAGNIAEDEYFKTNITSAINEGLEVGVYFFSYAITEDEAIAEAEWVAGKLEEYGVQDKCKYIAYDFESYNLNRAKGMSKSQLNKNTIAFLNRVKELEYTPILYGNKNYLTNYFDTAQITSSVEETKVWLAQYNDKYTYDGNFDMWQYTSQGTINGISGNVDMNIIYF